MDDLFHFLVTPTRLADRSVLKRIMRKLCALRATEGLRTAKNLRSEQRRWGGCSGGLRHLLNCSSTWWLELFSLLIPKKCLISSSSLNVKPSHDATCVPSTCSDNDGHPERSSTIVPGEPTGQELHQPHGVFFVNVYLVRQEHLSLWFFYYVKFI